MAQQDVYWAGPLDPECQISKIPFGNVMYDARTPLGWANICQETFDAYECKLGTGYGQKYELQIDGRWKKVAG